MRNILLCLASCVVCIVLGEVAVRALLPSPGVTVFPPHSPNLLVPNERRSYAYRPGYTGVAGGKIRTELAINNLGMRDDAVVPGEHIDVLAVGDSFTAGYMIKVDEAWPARLEYHLQQDAEPGAAVRVLNGGVSGYSIRQIRYAAEDYLLALKPDVLVVGAYLSGANRLFSPYVVFGGYTVRQHTLAFLKRTDQGFLKALDTPAVSANTQFWLMENFKLGAWIWLQLGALFEEPVNAPVYASVEAEFVEYADELRLLKAATDAAGVELVVMLVAHQEMSGAFSDRLKSYNRVVTEYCVANGIAVYDPTPILEGNAEDGPEFRAGGFDFHWSPLGHELAAKGLAVMLIDEALLKPSTPVE